MDIELEEIKEWQKLRILLSNNYEINDNWISAINLFKERIDRKYFTPIEYLIKEEVNQGEGFTILTTQCAIIESLASFRKGKIFNHRKDSQSPSYEYSKSARKFVDFLHTDDVFKNNFWILENNRKKKNKPFNANEFYADVRCGLLHEARTKGNWFITTNSNNSETETLFLENKNEIIKIFRSTLHYRLKKSVDKYCEDLKVVNSNGNKLRRLFGRKLDHLFGEKDITFDWWQCKNIHG